jgi:hypothetical protein
MQQPCPRCGYVSDRPTRFCRQCGAQLFVENEVTSATTRQHPPQQNDAPYASQYTPGGWLDNETSRFYRPPEPPNYQNYPASYQVTEPKKSNALKWMMITLLCFLLLGGGVVAMVVSAIRAKHRVEFITPSGEEIAADIREKVEREVQRAIEDAERAQKDAQPAAEEAAGAAPQPPLPPAPPGGEAAVDLDKYIYPGATMDGQVRIVDNGVLNMRTRDGFEVVKKFYQQLLGEPVIESNENDERKLVFQSTGVPSALVTIQPDEQHSGYLQIIVIRSRIRFPRIDAK